MSSMFMVASLTRLRRILIFAMALVAIFGLVAELWYSQFPSKQAETWVGLFSLSHEANIPTWYASSLLFLCGVCLVVIASEVTRSRAMHKFHWWGLAVVFFYISLDEAVGFHENLSGFSEAGGLLYFDWVIPAGIVAGLFALIYIPFLKNLPKRTRSRFLVAGMIYIFGALVMELPLGFWAERYGDENLIYALIDWGEEVMELLGISLFLVALGDHMGFQKDVSEEIG